MANATAMVVSAGFDYLNSSTSFNVAKASLIGWQNAAAGLAAVFVFLFLIILGGYIVYIRTNRAIPAAFAMLIMVLVENHYHFLDISIFKWNANYLLGAIIVIILIGIGLEVAKLWGDK